MTEDKVFREIGKLRDPKRLALLETERVVRLALEGVAVETVLDVGTGSGLFAEAFVQKGLRVTGVDLQEQMLETARRFVPQASFRQATSEHLPFADKTFDLVFMGLLLHETEDPATSVREAVRVARQRMAILEWPYKEQPFGPPLGHRIPEETIWNLLKQAGLPQGSTVPLTHLVLYLADG